MIVKKAVLAPAKISWRAPVASSPLRAVVGLEGFVAPEKENTVREVELPREVATLSMAEVLEWLQKQPENARRELAGSLGEELDELRETARVEGFQHGREQGIKEAHLAHSRSIELLATASSECQVALERELATMGECTIIVLEEVLRKIAGPLLASREAITGAVVEVIGRLKHERQLSIRVAPADLPILQAFQSRIAAALGEREYELVADPSIAGGCVVDSNLGSLDGRLELQLKELLDLISQEKRLVLGLS